MPSVFQEIKERIDIVDYISKFVKLQNRGGRYIGLCPFHSEKTASFNVDAQKKLFHCFGCNAGGDVFEFFMKYHNVSIQEALNSLANSCGINLARKNTTSDLDKLCSFFQENLSLDIKTILQKRGLTENSIDKFQLGETVQAFKINEYIKSQKLNVLEYGFNDYAWKMFEKRIMFPIFDSFGKICSFGGRVYLPHDKRAKYINGPASKYFSKSQILYGFHSIKRFMPIYVVEGYIDVILMQQNGLNAVAPLGTAFNKEQLLLLFAQSSEIIIAMDGDNSGKKSALNIAHIALELLDGEHDLKFVQLPPSEDPASFLMHSNFKTLKHYSLYEYIFMQEYDVYLNSDNKSPEKAVQVYKKLVSLADKIKDKTLKSEYKKRWKELWWNRDKVMRSFVSLPQKIDLPLLLFKYVLAYPDIISEVAEHFARLPIDDFFKAKQIQQDEISFYNAQVFSLLNEKNLDESFIKKINNLSINAVLGEDIKNKEDAIKAWYKVADNIEKIIDKQSSERINALENNFCQEEWDKFKSWLDTKETYDKE